jgi:hypothetical protein
MDEPIKKTASYIETERDKAQASTIRQIFEQGLHASEFDPRLRSHDPIPNKKLSLYLVEPKLTDKAKRSPGFFPADLFLASRPRSQFELLIHEDVYGIWPIILERSFLAHDQALDKNSDRLEWEDRLNSSLLFILRYPVSAPKEPTQEPSPSACKIAYEWPSEIVVSKDEIIAIIAPPSIASMCKQFYPGVTVYETTACQKIVQIPTPKSEDYNEYLQGPDYASILESLEKQQKLPSRFACHATRLPSKRDLLKLPHHRTPLSLENLLKKFDAPTPDAALRKIAHGHGCREDLEFLASVVPVDSIINNQSSTNSRTAMHWALYKKEIDIGMVQALLRFKPRLDISDGTGKTVAQVANLRRLKLVEIENGTYDIQLFTQRALADPVVIKETQTLPEMDIRSYQPRWL